MSSYADANTAYRRARYHSKPMSRRQALALKLGLSAAVLATLAAGFTSVAYGGGRTGTEQLVVQPGQSLWAIAQDRYPDEDTRSKVGEIIRLNHIDGQAIYAGERLQVPAN